MKQYYTDNLQLYLILIIWLLVGMFGGPLIYVVLPISLLLMKKQERYEELLLGFLLILILSDSYDFHLHFAKSVKNIYISVLTIFFLMESGSFQPLNSIYKTFFPFFIISLYCLIFTETFSISIQKTFSYFLMYLIVPNYLVKLYRQYGAEVLKNILFFMITILIVSILCKYLLPNLANTGGRYRGIFGNPNGLGLFCFLSFIFFFVVNHIHKNLFDRFQLILVYSIIMISLFMSGSRNSIIGVLMFLFFQKFYKINPFLGFVVVLSVGYGVVLLENNLATIISSLGLGEFFRIETLENGSGRYVAWLFAWNHIQENFFIGKGFGYDEHYMRSNWDLLSQMGHQGGVHNTFLTFWMNTGLIGLIIYLFAYLITFLKAAKQNPLAFPILFVVTFTAFFESWLVGSLNPHTIIFLMVLTLISDESFYPEETKVSEEETEALLLEENGIKA